MTKFFDTSLGKSLRVTLWLLASYGISFAVTYVTNHSFTGIYAVLPALVNIVAFSFNTIKDPTTPTLPSSPVMKLVPVTPQTDGSLAVPTPSGEPTLNGVDQLTKGTNYVDS